MNNKSGIDGPHNACCYREHCRKLEAEVEALKDSLKEIIAISDRKHDAWDKAKELLTEHNRPDFFYMEHDLQGDRND